MEYQSEIVSGRVIGRPGGKSGDRLFGGQQAFEDWFIFVETDLLGCAGANAVAISGQHRFVAGHPKQEQVKAKQQQMIEADAYPAQGCGVFFGQGDAEVIISQIAFQPGRTPLEGCILNQLQPEAQAFCVLRPGQTVLFRLQQRVLRQTQVLGQLAALIGDGQRGK